MSLPTSSSLSRIKAGASRSRLANWPAIGLLSIALVGCFEPSVPEQVAQAKERLLKGDSAAAMIHLKSALQRDGNAPEARYLLGVMLLDGGDPAGAGIELSKARELGYTKDLVIPLQARSLVEQGQFDKALAGYADVTLTLPKQQAALKLALAGAYLGQQKFDAARAATDEALKLDADSLAAQLFDARLLSVDRKYAQALQALDRSLGRWPRSAEAWELKANVLQANGAETSAIGAAFAEAVKADPRSLSALSGLFISQLLQGDRAEARKALDSLVKQSPKHPQTLYSQALFALNARDYKAAVQHAQALLKVTPESPRALHLAGAVDYERGAYLRAESSLIKVIQRHPEAGSARLLLARAYLGLEEPVKALQTLQPLLNTLKASPDALMIAGQANLVLGKSLEAEKLFTRAVAADPKDFRGRTALAVSHLTLGREDQAVEELTRIAAQDAEPRADVELIAAYIRRSDFTRAQEAIKALDNKLPNGVQAPMLRAQIALAQGDTPHARAGFEAALQRQPTHFPAAQALAELDLQDKQPAKGVSRLEALLKADPTNVRAQLAVIGLRRQMGLNREDERRAINAALTAHHNDPLPRLALADFHIGGQEFKPALSVATEGAALFPDDPRFLDLLGQAQQATGDLNQAKQTFQKAVALQPRSPLPLMRLANLYTALRDAPNAIASLRRAVAVRPDYVPAHASLVGLLVGSGRFAEALAEAKTVQKLTPASPLGWVLEGNLQGHQKNWNAAIGLYTKAFSMNPGGDIAVRLYSAYQAAGRTNDAAKFETEWLAAHPHEVHLQTFIGDNALRRDDLAEAQLRYVDALKGAPENPMLLNNLAWVYQLEGKREAVELAQRAVKLAPKVPQYVDTLARAYAVVRQLDKAIPVQQQLLTLDPDQPQHRLRLAEYQIAAGNKDAAREQLRSLAALGKKFPKQAEVQKLMQSL